jgi:hypothetical protein
MYVSVCIRFYLCYNNPYHLHVNIIIIYHVLIFFLCTYFKGVVGLFFEPLAGLWSDGLKGLFIGSFKGSIGLFSKPFYGMLRTCSNSLNNLSYKMVPRIEGEQKHLLRRIKPPTYLHIGKYILMKFVYCIIMEI